MDKDLRIEALERQVDFLTEKVAALETVLTGTFVAPIEWRLTPAEERVFGALVARDVVTKNLAMAALYFDRPGDAPNEKIADVFICKLRKKVCRFGVEITTVWGRGWTLSNREKFRVAA